MLHTCSYTVEQASTVNKLLRKCRMLLYRGICVAVVDDLDCVLLIEALK